ECLEEGELLCRVPAGLHFSRQSCKKLMPEVFVACEQLPSAVPEKREEAADALCMALLLLGARARSAPQLWHCCADSLLGLAADFEENHPYIRALASEEGGEEPPTTATAAATTAATTAAITTATTAATATATTTAATAATRTTAAASFAPSVEPELVAAQAKYVQTVFRCVQEALGAEVQSVDSSNDISNSNSNSNNNEHNNEHNNDNNTTNNNNNEHNNDNNNSSSDQSLDQGLYLLAWLCLLTRRFSGPEGSSLVPGVDFMNHSAAPNASSDWDEDSCGGAVVVRALRPIRAGEEIYICYGSRSNPLLWRTHGFTLPASEEPSWSCTFSGQELVEAAQTCSAQGQRATQDDELRDFLDELRELPNVHLDSSHVTDELAGLLQVCSQGAAAASLGVQPAGLLRRLCVQRLALVPGPKAAAVGSCDASNALLREALKDPWCAADRLGAWWTARSGREASGGLAEENASRVCLSEYLCLQAHLQ
ncbi:unnamed protein product, partial [Polarella glacialis]